MYPSSGIEDGWSHTGNPDTERDLALFDRLGLRAMQVTETANTVHADIVDAEPAFGAASMGCGTGCGCAA